MTPGKEHEREEDSGDIKISDLDLLRNGKSADQNVPAVLRRAMVKAVRKGRVWGPDDGDTLGKSDVFTESPFEDDGQ